MHLDNRQPIRRGPYLDELEVGRTFLSGSRTVTEADLVNYAGFSGDFHPLHSDEEYAKKTEFGTRILHGPAVFAMATGLMYRTGMLDETAVAFLGMDWKLHRPVLVGDTIRVSQTVAAYRRSRSHSDRGVATFDVQVLNQHNDICHRGQWSLMFLTSQEQGAMHGS